MTVRSVYRYGSITRVMTVRCVYRYGSITREMTVRCVYRYGSITHVMTVRCVYRYPKEGYHTEVRSKTVSYADAALVVTRQETVIKLYFYSHFKGQT